MIFQQLTVKNLFSFEDFSIDLHTHGITLIKGRNGSGKSNILRCISFCLFGNFGDEVVNQKIGEAGYVRLEGEKDGVLFLVERYRKDKKNKNNVYLTIDGNVVEAATNTDLQNKLESFLSLDLDTFNNIVSFSSDAMMFAAAGDSTRKQIFEKLIHGLDIYSTLCDKAKDKVSEIESAVNKLKSEQEADNRELALTKKMMEDEGDKAKNFDSFIQTRAKAIEYELGVCEMDSRNNTKQGLELIAKINRYSLAQLKIDICIEKYVSRFETLDFIPKEICPTCGQDIKIQKVEDERLLVQTTKMYLTRKKDYLRSCIANFNMNFKFIEADEKKKKQTISNLQFQLEETKNMTNEHAKSYKHLKGNLLEIGNRMFSKTVQCTELEEDKLYYEELVRIFSKTGIPNAIIGRYLDMLEQITNNYLDVLSNGALGIRFTGTTKTKAGLTRNKIGIEVMSSSGVVEYQRYSGGQKQRVNIALLLALREIAKLSKGVDIKLLLLDEILDLSLDEAGVDDVLTLLESKIQDIGSIFVLSPKDQFIANTARFNDVKTLTIVNGITQEV